MKANEIFKAHRLKHGIKHRHLFLKTGIQGNQIKLFEEGRKDFTLTNAIRLFNAAGLNLNVAPHENNAN